MTEKEYYTAPSEKVFEEIKKAAIEIWQTYDNTHGYATEKINWIKDIKNIRDNAWFIVAMFDENNQAKLVSKVSSETAELIIKAKN